MKKIISLVGIVASLAACTPTHLEVIERLKNLKGGVGYEVEVTEAGYPIPFISLEYSPDGGFVLAEGQQGATGMYGTSFLDTNADGNLDSMIFLRRHFLGSHFLGSSDTGVDFNCITGHEHDNFNAYGTNVEERIRCPRPGELDKAQSGYESKISLFLDKSLIKK